MGTQIITKMKIAKTINEVFEAIVDPDKMSNYWFSTGTAIVEQGKTITWRYDEYNAEVIIHVMEVEDNRKIVYSWGKTIVTIKLKEDDTQTTIIEITESGFNDNDPDLVDKMIGQKEGWVYMLTCLKGYLENGVNNLRASLIH